MEMDLMMVDQGEILPSSYASGKSLRGVLTLIHFSSARIGFVARGYSKSGVSFLEVLDEQICCSYNFMNEDTFFA